MGLSGSSQTLLSCRRRIGYYFLNDRLVCGFSGRVSRKECRGSTVKGRMLHRFGAMSANEPLGLNCDDYRLLLKAPFTNPDAGRAFSFFSSIATFMSDSSNRRGLSLFERYIVCMRKSCDAINTTFAVSVCYTNQSKPIGMTVRLRRTEIILYSTTSARVKKRLMTLMLSHQLRGL